MAEPLAVCLHAVARAGDVTGKRAVLFGAGPIGLLTMLAAQRAGIAETTVVDIAAAPLAFATRLGADHVVDISGGDEALKAEAAARPFDVAFEVSGTAAGLASAIGVVRRGGVVVQVGNLPGGQIPVPANAVMAKEIDLRGSFRFGHGILHRGRTDRRWQRRRAFAGDGRNARSRSRPTRCGWRSTARRASRSC